MPITLFCECGWRLRVEEGHPGQQTKCPYCKALLTIPHVPGNESAEPSLTPSDGLDTEAADPYRLVNSGTYSPESYEMAEAAVLVEERERNRSRRPAPIRPAPVMADNNRGGSAREYLYLALGLALIPLALSLLSKEDASVGDRIEHALAHVTPEVKHRVEQAVGDREEATLDDLLSALPGNRLDETAHLPRTTLVHWVYAAFAAVAFWGFIVTLFPQEKITPAHALIIGLFTGTVGIAFLLCVQYLADATDGVWIRSRSGPILVLFYLAKFVGFSYASANDPEANVLLSFLGFTCGVGLCEELCKALPLINYYTHAARMHWRGACVWGLASGVGFGVCEGIIYAGEYYNGISPASMYVIRFVSCVALHAIWSGSVALSLWRRQESLRGDLDWTSYCLVILQALAVPMVLHGLYDTLLKKDMEPLALAAGLASIAWFVWQVESARSQTSSEPASQYATA